MQHVLIGIVEHCLEDLPEDRPPIEEVIQKLEEARMQIPDCFGEMTKQEVEQENQSLQLQLETLQVSVLFYIGKNELLVNYGDKELRRI